MPSIRDIIRGKVPKGGVQQNKRALVCIDAANLIPALRRDDITIDWKEFKGLLDSQYSKVRLIFYWGNITDDFHRKYHPRADTEEIIAAKSKQTAWFEGLKQLGYELRTKPISTIHTGGDTRNFKCNFDVEIAIDAMDFIEEFDVFVLCSGDGDFIPLLKRLKRALKLTHVIAVKGRFHRNLKKTANSYDYVSELLFWVKRLRRKK